MAGEAAHALFEIQAQLTELFAAPDGRRVLDRCAQAKFSVLGLGSKRVAVLLDEQRVAKLAWRAQGIVDNELEWRLWNSAEPELRALLAPAREFQSGILVQARCLPARAEALPGSSDVIAALARAGITDAAINLGLFEGRVVCYDYSVLAPGLARKLLSLQQSAT